MSRLVNELFEALGKTAGFSVDNRNEDRRRLKALYEATKDEEDEDDDEVVDDEDTGEDEELDFDDEDDGEDVDDEDLDFDDEDDDDDLNDDGLVDDEEFGNDLDADIDLDDDSIEDSKDTDVDFEDFDIDGDAEMADYGDLDSLTANEPPMDMFGGEELDKSSDFSAFITNQLIDFPVDNIKFEEKEGAKYVDARFGEKDITFVLYTGEEGEPLIAMIHKDVGEEVVRLELPPEAVEADGNVRNEFMPVAWIRDNLARIIDTAPTFECYRLSNLTRDCNEVYTLKKKKRNSVRVMEALKLNKSAGKAIKTKKMKPVAKASKNAVKGKKVITSKVKILDK